MPESYSGFYRATVVDNADPEKQGRVKVWVPDIMPEVEKNQGLWANPGNNPLGGRNKDEKDTSHHYMGTCYIPKKGSWVWVFFESGNINRPFYFGSLDLQNTKVLPENQLGKNYYDKWTIFKSHQGRCVVISDDGEDARVEITGKKRKLKSPPTGDTESVYEIDKNQTVILLDEREGQEKILIRTHKGDFLTIDIEEQKLKIFVESDIYIKSNGSIYLGAKENITLKSGKNIHSEASGQNNVVGAKINIVGPTAADGSYVKLNSGDAKPDACPTVTYKGTRNK
jgi:hypothetical protein